MHITQKYSDPVSSKYIHAENNSQIVDSNNTESNDIKNDDEITKMNEEKNICKMDLDSSGISSSNSEENKIEHKK